MKRVTWHEFILPENGRSVMCAAGNGGCLLRMDGPYTGYTVMFGKDGQTRLFDGMTGEAEVMPGTDNFSLRADDGGAVSLNVARNEGSLAVQLREEFSSTTHTFHYNNGAVAMDCEATPSMLKAPTKLRLGKSHGIGVFATEDIGIYELVEEAPMLGQEGPFLGDYTFSHKKQHLLALGYGSLYNHSDTPNLLNSIRVDEEGRNVMVLRAARPIRAGEECTIDYGPLYFPSRGLTAARV